MWSSRISAPCDGSVGPGAEESTNINDRLIYLSMPGFSSDDERAGIPGWEGVVSAPVGTYSGSLMADAPQPVYTAVPIASSYAAITGCAGVAMALVARERDGFGQQIEASLHDSLYQAIGIRGLKYLDRDAPRGRCRGSVIRIAPTVAGSFPRCVLALHPTVLHLSRGAAVAGRTMVKGVRDSERLRTGRCGAGSVDQHLPHPYGAGV